MTNAAAKRQPRSNHADTAAKRRLSSATTATPPIPSATLLTEEVYRAVGQARRLLWMAAARGLEARGQSIFAWQVLCYLVRHRPTTQRDLAHMTAQDPAAISRLMDDLLERGLVRRRRDAEDRRKLLVEVTTKGRAWFQSASPVVMEAVEQALSGLTIVERRKLRDLLEALVEPARDGGLS